MWPWTGWKLQKALRRYRNDRDLETLLQMNWGNDPLLNTLFSDVEERLHGEEITKLRQKQSEYLALRRCPKCVPAAAAGDLPGAVPSG